MRTLNNKNRIDRAVGAAENISTGEEKMSNSSKKTPWRLRFAPGVLRPIGRLAFKAVSLASAIIQPIRQRLNQWNWRKKTALVTALAIVTGGVFYQQRTQAAALLGVILAAKPADFFVKFFIAYALGTTLNSAFAKKLQKTADATPDGEPLYSNREYNVRDYSFDDSGTKTENYRVDADANALYHKAYDTSGTDTRYDPSTLEQREVLDYVSHNTHLNATTEEYQILNDGEPLYRWDVRWGYNRRTLETFAIHYGGYVQRLTAEEIQEELDYIRDDWNRYNRGMRYRRPVTVGNLTLGPKVGQVDKRFVCDKEVRLWSKFKFNRIAGDTSANPRQLQTPGDRPNYVTELSYYAREAGYGPLYGIVVTKVPKNEEPFIEYPKPRSYNNHSYMEHDLDSIIWANYKITEEPTWIGSATRYFKSKSRRGWCKKHNRFYRRSLPYSHPCRKTLATRYEYKLFQNESVEEPAN